MLGALFEQEDEDFPIFVEENVVSHPEASAMKGKKKVCLVIKGIFQRS